MGWNKVGSNQKGGQVAIPPPPPGFSIVKQAAAVPPPPKGFEVVPPAAVQPPDPLKRNITRAEDLPGQDEFDASHEAAGAAMEQMLTHPPTPNPQMRAPAAKQGMGGRPPASPGVARTFSDFAAGVKEFANTPGLPVTQLVPDLKPTSKVGKAALGVTRGAAELVEGLSTPLNVGMLVAGGPAAKILTKVSPLLPRAVSAIFSLDMLNGLSQEIPEVADAVKSGDPERIAKSVTKASGTAAFATLAGKHAIRGEGRPSSAQLRDRVLEGDRAPKPTTPPTSAQLRDRVLEGEPLKPEATVAEKPGRTSRTDLAAMARGGVKKRLTADDLRKMKESLPEGFSIVEPKADAGAIVEKQTKPGKTAADSAQVFDKAGPTYTELFDEAVKGAPGEQRKAALAAMARKPAADKAAANKKTADMLRGMKTGKPESSAELAELPAELSPEAAVPPEVIEKAAPKVVSETPGEIAAESGKIGNKEVPPASGKIPAGTPQEAPKPAEVPTPQAAPESVTPPAEPAKSAVPERLPKTPPVAGKTVEVKVPGEETPYPARYVVREMEDVQASHNGLNFEPNPNYEIKNDRDYQSNEHLQAAVVERSGDKFDPSFTVGDYPTAEHGPSIIDQRGNVLGGNSRVQTMQRVDEYNPAGREKYNAALKEKAASLGIDPEAVGKMKRPVLLRELTGEHDSQRAVTDFNKGAPAKLKPHEQAVADGRRLSPKTVQDIAARLGDLGDSGTMAEALRGDNGAEVLNLLEKDGVITAQEKGGLVDQRDQLTPEMKSRISKALVGRLFSTPAEYSNTPPAVHAKLERVAPQVLRVEGRSGWNITEHVRDAVSLLEEARAHKSKVADTAAQIDMSGERKVYSPEAVRIAEVMEESPRNVEYAFRRYANDEALSRPGAQGSMFEPPPQHVAFADAFGDLPPRAETPIEQPMRGLEDKVARPSKKNSKKAGTKGFIEKLVSDESGEARIPTRADIEKIKRAYEDSDTKVIVDAGKSVLRSLGARVRAEGGGAGRVLMKMIEKADDYGDLEAGRLLVRIADAQPSRLSRAQRFDIVDALEGRIHPNKLDSRARVAYDAYKEADTELGLQATGLGIEVMTKNGWRPFSMMENHYPHVLKAARELKRGAVRRDVIDNIVRLGIKADKAEATAFVDDWVSYLESGKRKESIIQHMVETKQAKTEAEALARLEKYRSNIARHGSLEYSRELNLPFYDPDPVRVMPFTLASGAKRLAQVAVFGQDHHVINQEILNIGRAGGNTDFVRDAVDRMIGKKVDTTDEAVVSRFIRSLSTLKMSLASIPNSTQVLNALTASDLPSFAAGLKGGFTAKGRRLAIESGAAIDPVLKEAMKQAGGSELMDNYLKLSGFQATERFNRAVSANAGVTWAKRNLAKASGSGRGAEQAKAFLTELGIDPAKAVKRGSLTEQEMLTAAKKFADATQFRTRPQDLPALATESAWGKAWFQFKGFAYQQARFAAKQTYGEFKAGRPERGMRNLLLLGVLYPYTTGELVRLLREKITGREDKFKSGLERYYNNLAASSSAGILLDAVNAAEQNRVPEFVGGPAVGQVTDFAKMMRELADKDKSLKAKEKAVGRYALTRFGSLPRRAVTALK